MAAAERRPRRRRHNDVFYLPIVRENRNPSETFAITITTTSAVQLYTSPFRDRFLRISFSIFSYMRHRFLCLFPIANLTAASHRRHVSPAFCFVTVKAEDFRRLRLIVDALPACWTCSAHALSSAAVLNVICTVRRKRFNVVHKKMQTDEFGAETSEMTAPICIPNTSYI